MLDFSHWGLCHDENDKLSLLENVTVAILE